MTELLTTEEVARILRCHPLTIHRWIKDGILEAVPLPRTGKKVCQSYRIKRSTLDTLLHRREGDKP